MNHLTKKLLKEGIIGHDSIFILERLIGEMTIDVCIFSMIKSSLKSDKNDIEEEYWRKRLEIINSGIGSKTKIAQCIFCDLKINKEYRSKSRKNALLKLITTIAIQYN